MDKRRMSATQTFNELSMLRENRTREILTEVNQSLLTKGYNPLNQIVGYIMSGDPTYITSFNNARALICELERDELMEEIISFYLKNNC